MPSTPKLVMVFAFAILVQLLIMDITRYYLVMIEIFTGARKIRYLDIILFIILSPSAIFLFIEVRLMNEDLLAKRIRSSKLYKWLKTEINTKK